jgi:hypothetical protein
MIEGASEINLKGFSLNLFSTILKINKDNYKGDFKKSY